MVGRAWRLMVLARWLGPLGGGGAGPRPDPPDTGRMGGGRVLLVPGMHFRGVEDPRFSRFSRVLGAAGARVWAADIRALRELRLGPAMFEDGERALMEASREGPVGVMSVSFGSIVALDLAARFPERVRRLVIFGGYRDLEATLAFTLGRREPGAGGDGPRVDPLNAPAVFIQLAEELLAEEARAPFIAAARRFCEATWSTGAGGAADDKHDGRHLTVGAALAETLEGEARALFRVACRLEADPLPVALEALARSRGRFGYLDPGPRLDRVRCPVDCVHGLGDDVIPHTEGEALASDLAARGVKARAIVTGLYGHTGGKAGVTAATNAPGLVERLRLGAHEARQMGAVLAVLERLVSRR